MTKEDIKAILQTIPYPGFSRDIVSFGMVHAIHIQDDAVQVVLKISTQQEEKKQAVQAAVREKLEATQAFSRIDVQLLDEPPTPAQPQPAETGSAVNGTIDHIIAVASGKGGVGKSTVAANLAVALQQRGYQVGLLDLDIYGPSLPITLGLNGQPEVTSDQKIIPLERYGMKVMSFGFLSGNETPVIWRGPLVARMTEQFFRDVKWGKLDYLILDLPPGTGDVQLTLSQKIPLTGAIIVTTPQDIALADVKKGADMFRKVNTPVLGVVENMSGFHVSGKIHFPDGSVPDGTRVTLAGTDQVQLEPDGTFSATLDVFKRGGGTRESERLGVPLLGVLPLHPDFMLATDRGEPLVRSHPESALARLYGALVDKLEQALRE
ncbi:MAG: MRP family ATP-binding protein [Candidatus Neomarinimicrobiota bacterium]|nr:MAG: MRP family ATP-binding protein [Candidatus Neomarinimicrobiota bacterium]